MAAWRSSIPREEIPTPEVIAKAIIAAAREMGEDPLGWTGRKPTPRSIKIAFHVVREFYPLYPGSRLGLALGLTANPSPILNSAKLAPWWNDSRAAFAAAAAALEAA